MRKIVLALLLCAMLPVCAAGDSLTVLIVTFRGLTDAEQGFMDHFHKKNLPVRFVLRDCGNDKNRLPAIAAEIPAVKPDLIYAFGTSAALGLAGPAGGDESAPARGIPLVFNIVADPVGAKLVRDLKSPGRDVTGVCHIVPMGVQLKALRSVLPLSTVGVIYNPEEKNSSLMVKQLEALADSGRFKVLKFAVAPSKEPDMAQAVDVLARQGARLLYLPSDSYIISRAADITARAVARRLPVYSATEEPLVKAGALLGVVSRYYNAGQFAGYKAEQILFQKVPARDIPVETLSRFSFIINMKAARAIGFIPPIQALKFAEVITE